MVLMFHIFHSDFTFLAVFIFFLENFIFSPWAASPAAGPWHLLGSRGAPGCMKIQAQHSAQALFKLLAQSLQSCPELTGCAGSAAPRWSKCKWGKIGTSISFSFTLNLLQSPSSREQQMDGFIMDEWQNQALPTRSSNSPRHGGDPGLSQNRLLSRTGWGLRGAWSWSLRPISVLRVVMAHLIEF